MLATTEMVQPELVLKRVGAIRTTMLAELDPASDDLDRLRRLAALDRYEARALARRDDGRAPPRHRRARSGGRNGHFQPLACGSL
jgi:hypothetical protein